MAYHMKTTLNIDDTVMTELKREADEDHPAIERAHQARPGGVLDERRLAALDVFRRHQGIGCETHPD